MGFWIKSKKNYKQLDKNSKKNYFKLMFKSISSYQALDAGSDLWILISDFEDFWFKKINWQLGFPFHDPSKKDVIKKPILVTTQNTFPNKNILCLPYTEDWIACCHQHWAQLKKPSLRLFLPKTLPKDSLEQWPDEDRSHSLSYLQTNLSSVR